MEESNHQQKKITHYRAIILAGIVPVLIYLSFDGGLDNFAQERVTETTDKSMKLYGVSRGINAVISTLQSSQVKVPFLVSIQIGEVLDPVNDAVERLSSAMVWAIGSLFLQRIVLEVAASPVFKGSFLVAGLIAISVLLIASWARSKPYLDRCRDVLVRIFVVAAIFRFIVPTFVVISSLVSQTFLETEINEHTKKLSAWEKDISEFRKHIIDEQNAREQSLEEQKGLGPVLPDEKRAQEQDSTWSSIGDAWSSIGDATAQMWDKMSMAKFPSISGTIEKASDMVTIMTKLLVAIVVENVILPIVFLMIVVKCSVPIAKYSGRLSSTLKRDSRERRDSLQQTV